MFSLTYQPNEVILNTSQVQELILLIARGASCDERKNGCRASTHQVDQNTMSCFELLCKKYSIPFHSRTYDTTGYANQFGGEYRLTMTGFDFTDSLEILLDKFSQAIPSLQEQLHKLKPSQDKAVLELANKVADISRITDAKMIQNLRLQPYKVTLSDVSSTKLNKLISLFRLHSVSCTISTSSSDYENRMGYICSTTRTTLSFSVTHARLMQYFDAIFSRAPTTSADPYLLAYGSALFSSTQAEVSAAVSLIDTYKADFSPLLEDYVEQFRDRPKFSDLLKNIMLTEAQENLLLQYKDPRTLEVMDLPVKLYGSYYNLQTILEAYSIDQKSPVGQKLFAISDIKKASKMYDDMKAIIDEILANQEPEYQPSTGCSIS